MELIHKGKLLCWIFFNFLEMPWGWEQMCKKAMDCPSSVRRIQSPYKNISSVNYQISLANILEPRFPCGNWQSRRFNQSLIGSLIDFRAGKRICSQRLGERFWFSLCSLPCWYTWLWQWIFLPGILKTIDKIRRGFLWRGRRDAKGGHCRWPSLRLLGYQNLETLGFPICRSWDGLSRCFGCGCRKLNLKALGGCPNPSAPCGQSFL